MVFAVDVTCLCRGCLVGWMVVWIWCLLVGFCGVLLFAVVGVFCFLVIGGFALFGGWFNGYF